MWNPFGKKEEGEFISQPEADSAYLGGREEEDTRVREEVFYENEELTEESADPIEELIEKPMPRFRKAVRVLILATVALLPVFFLPFTAPGNVLGLSKQILIYISVMASLVIWLVMIIKQGGLFLRKSGLEWGVLAVVGSGLLSSVFSAQSYGSFMGDNGLAVLGMLALLFVLTLNFFEKEEGESLINFFLLGSGLAVLIGVLMAVGVPIFEVFALIFPKNVSVQAQFNTVGSMNALGSLAALSLVMVLASYFGIGRARWARKPKPEGSMGGVQIARSGESFLGAKTGRGEERSKWEIKQWFWTVVRIGAALVSAWLILVLNWWVFYLVLASGVLGIVIGPAMVERKIGRRIKMEAAHFMIPLIILVLAIGLTLASAYSGFDLIGASLRKKIPTEVYLSQGSSWEIARKVLDIKPIFGVGKENFTLAYDQFRPVSINSTIFWNNRFSDGSSQFINLIVEEGLVGLAALAFLLFYVLKQVFGRREMESKGEAGHDFSSGVYQAEDRQNLAEERWSIFPMFMAILTLFFLYPFNLLISAVFWIILALLGIKVRPDNNIQKVKMNDASLSSVFSSLVLVAVLVAGLAGGVMLFQKYSANLYFSQAARWPVADGADLDKVIDLVSKAVDTDSGDDNFSVNLGSLLLRKINLELKNTKEKPEVVRSRLQGLIKTVLRVTNQMVTQHKNNAINWFNAGQIYENLIPILSGAEDEALSSYQQYAKLAPNDPNGYLRMGTVYLIKADRNVRALSDAKAKKLNIKNEAEVKSGIAASYQGAEENFSKAVTLKGDLASAVYYLGVIYEREGKLKEAVAQLELTKIANPNNAGLAFELGLLYYRNGQKDNAFSEMGRAVLLFKNYANAHWYLALMLEEKGQIDLAIEHLQEILTIEVNKDNPVVLDKLASLQAGQREIPPGKVTGRLPLEATMPSER